VLLASLPLPTRRRLGLQGWDPGRGDPRRCAPSPPRMGPWPLSAQTATTGLFQAARQESSGEREEPGDRGGSRPSLQSAFPPSRGCEGFGVVAQQPLRAGSPEGNSGARSRPCIHHTRHCSLENTRCCLFLFSVPTSFISSPCPGLGSTGSTPEPGWGAGHGGLPPSPWEMLRVGGCSRLSPAARPRRAGCWVAERGARPWPCRAAAGREATMALSAKRRSTAVGS